MFMIKQINVDEIFQQIKNEIPNPSIRDLNRLDNYLLNSVDYFSQINEINNNIEYIKNNKLSDWRDEHLEIASNLIDEFLEKKPSKSIDYIFPDSKWEEFPYDFNHLKALMLNDGKSDIHFFSNDDSWYSVIKSMKSVKLSEEVRYQLKIAKNYDEFFSGLVGEESLIFAKEFVNQLESRLLSIDFENNQFWSKPIDYHVESSLKSLLIEYYGKRIFNVIDIDFYGFNDSLKNYQGNRIMDVPKVLNDSKNIKQRIFYHDEQGNVKFLNWFSLIDDDRSNFYKRNLLKINIGPYKRKMMSKVLVKYYKSEIKELKKIIKNIPKYNKKIKSFIKKLIDENGEIISNGFIDNEFKKMNSLDKNYDLICSCYNSNIQEYMNEYEEDVKFCPYCGDEL